MFHNDAIYPNNIDVIIFIIPRIKEFIENISSYCPIFWNGIVMIACITGTVPFVSTPIKKDIATIKYRWFVTTINTKKIDSNISAVINTGFGPNISNKRPHASLPKSDPTVNPTVNVPIIFGSNPLKIRSNGKKVKIFSLLNAFNALDRTVKNTGLDFKMANDGIADVFCLVFLVNFVFCWKNINSIDIIPNTPNIKHTIFQPDIENNVRAAIYPATAIKGILPISPIAVKSLSILPNFCRGVLSVR